MCTSEEDYAFRGELVEIVKLEKERVKYNESYEIIKNRIKDECLKAARDRKTHILYNKLKLPFNPMNREIVITVCYELNLCYVDGFISWG